MSTPVWILVWAVVLGTVAFFLVREVRSGRKQPDDFDRTTHDAVAESMTMQQRTRARGQGLGI